MKEISKDTMLATSVVSDVLDSLEGVLVEELVRTGKTSIYGLVTITSASRPAYETIYGAVEAQDVLSSRISKPIRDMFRVYGPSSGKSGFITAQNWRKFLNYWKESEKQSQTESPKSSQYNTGENAASSLDEQLDDLIS